MHTMTGPADVCTGHPFLTCGGTGCADQYRYLSIRWGIKLYIKCNLLIKFPDLGLDP